MRKVIGIGETILDIIFKNEQPTAAIPGGSVFNGIISMGRAGAEVCFISEIGNDRVGNIIKQFMNDNHVSTKHVNIFPDGKSPISLAFLDGGNEADYTFYKDYPKQRLDVSPPTINEDDILIFGSYYALNPALRERVVELLEYAALRKAIIYYDPNFRSTHKHEAMRLTSVIIENLEYADIVRGSSEDFTNMYQLEDVDKVYLNKIKFYCPNFICTKGSSGISLRTKTVNKEYSVEPISTVSTVGAGDNFNAGIILGLLKYGVKRQDLDQMNEQLWDQVIQCGKEFAAEACKGFDNYVSTAFAKKYR